MVSTDWDIPYLERMQLRLRPFLSLVFLFSQHRLETARTFECDSLGNMECRTVWK